jgi:hypothetical protein
MKAKAKKPPTRFWVLIMPDGHAYAHRTKEKAFKISESNAKHGIETPPVLYVRADRLHDQASAMAGAVLEILRATEHGETVKIMKGVM